MTIKELKGGIRYILNLMEAGEYSKDYAIDEITVKFIEWYKEETEKLIPKDALKTELWILKEIERRKEYLFAELEEK